MRNNAFTSLVITMLLLGLPASSLALSLQHLIMPGPLSNAHAKYEKECVKCHDSFDKTKHRANCLACHKEVASDISKNTGFHGKSEDVGQQECLHCHTEHKGRDGDIILMDLDNFDHANTDFFIQGTHVKVHCTKCHVSGKKFRDAQGECFSCHKEMDLHKGAFGEKCQNCHKETQWKEHSFDHKSTKFQLQGVHEGLPCVRCHVNQKWKDLPSQCVSCHKVNDIHSERFGVKCEKCHSTEKLDHVDKSSAQGKSGWSNTHFDHQKTTFPLSGKHEKVACMQCHQQIELTDGVEKKKEKPVCFICHQKKDDHKTRFGSGCEKCHTVDGWDKTILDHDKTNFPLLTSHQKVPCIKCHTGIIFKQKLSTECATCHRLDDKHAGSFGVKCENCHTITEWKAVEFDHTKTKFTLTGKHLKVQCAKCHYGVPAGASFDTSCNACHNKNDVHKGQEGKKCEKCHNVAGWRENIFFDHDLASFPLIGMHSVAPCEACHPSNTFKDTSIVCKDCHLEKDRHKEAFGSKCDLCHTPNGWKIWAFDHSQSQFLLTGAHIGLDCNACHQQPLTIKNYPPKKCATCHRRDDAHRGKYGKYCDRCHTTESFKTLLIGK